MFERRDALLGQWLRRRLTWFEFPIVREAATPMNLPPENSDSQEELVGVICHEIAHIELNHVMKKLVKEPTILM